MSREWTTAQESAIYGHSKNIIVSAAAGSGKTTVLTERIFRLILDGADISRMLVVTFTDAATNEMKQRITSRINKAAIKEPDPLVQARLRSQAMAVGRANISTLHSFCLYILRRNFHRLNLDPAFTTADEILSAMLFKEALETAAEEAYSSKDEGFKALLRGLHGKEEELFEHVKSLHTFIKARPDPLEWLDLAVMQYRSEEDLKDNPASVILLRAQKVFIGSQIGRLAAARALIPDEERFVKVKSIFDEDMAMLRALSNSGDHEIFRERLFAIKFRNFSWNGKDNPDIKDKVHRERKSVQTAIKERKKLLALSAQEEKALMLKMYPAIKALADFTRSVDKNYAQLKQLRAKVDFSDMEHLALAALDNPDIRSALMNRFDYIFVDEYQDSSLIQERILNKVKRENNLFLVGDVKQSIYRFRQAEPELFISKLKHYDGSSNGVSIHLNVNYRSSSAVIDAVNTVFSKIMSEEAGEIEYDENAALNYFEGKEATELDGVEFHLIDRARPGEGIEEEDEAEPEDAVEDDDSEGGRPDEDEEETLDAVTIEAGLAASRIHELMAAQSFTQRDGTVRPLRYSDFAVLLRSHRRAGEVWAAALSQAGIPAYVQLTGGYFDAIEVQVFLNLLRVIDNKRQDVPLLSVLRSPIFGFDEHDLIELRTQYKEETLFESLDKCAKDETKLSEKARNVFACLSRWRHEALLLPLNEFVAQMLDESRFYESMGALVDGRERQANLDALATRAREYADAGGACDLYSFLSYMDGAKDTAKMGGAKPGAKDVVRILSVHRAKGLEFPIVILGGLANRFNTKAYSSNILMDNELFLGAKLVVDGVRKDTFLRRAVAYRMRRKDVAEEMRILYVGMTRAVSRLILIAGAKDAKKRLSDAKNIDITPGYCENASSCLDWLLPALYKSAVNVQLSAPEKIKASEQVKAAPNEEEANRDLEILRERFSWRYPYEDAVDIPSKLSVSELLSPRAESSFSDAPSFVREREAITPAQAGAAAHLFMKEAAHAYEGDTLAHVESELRRLLQRGVLNEAQAKAISKKDMAWFLESDMNRRCNNADKVERELEFSTELPANTLIKTKSTEPILLQGVIDCCFFENGEWVLLDYKTDRVRGSIEEAAGAHAPQLELYARALNKLTGKNVKERYVVMLRAHEIVRVK